MEIKIELDLAAMLSAAVCAERIQPIIEKAMDEALKGAIGQATGNNSEFRKVMEVQLKEAMPHGLSISDVAKFQHVLNSATTEAVHGENAKTIHAALAAGARAVIPDLPSRVTLSELLVAARKGFHKERHEAFYAHLEMTDYGYGHLYLDEDEGCRSDYAAAINLHFDTDGCVYAMKFDGKQLTPSSVPTVVGRFEGLLLSMYVGRTSIALDVDEGEVEFAALGDGE